MMRLHPSCLGDLPRAVRRPAFRRERLRYGIVHLGIGKRSFSVEQLVENYQTVLDEILRAKPAASDPADGRLEDLPIVGQLF